MAVTFEEQIDMDSGHVSETEKESILNNLGTLASMPYGAAPFLRDAGVHMPENLSSYSRNQYATEVINQAEMYEDRAEVTEVTIDEKGNAKVVVAYGSE